MKSKDRIIIQKIINYIDDVEKYDEIPWKSIKGMRNKIVHDYENVDLSVLWGTIKNSLPDLKDRLKNIILEEVDTII